MTVFPGSNVILNCSIVTEGLAQGMTWSQMLEQVKNSTGLPNFILERSNSTTNSGKHSCQCTTINFTRALEIVYFTSTPNDIIQDKIGELKCVFLGWPLPRTVLWHKDNELISNGTEGIYHSLQEKGETLHSILHLPHGREEQAGFYNCSATNSIPGWSSSASKKIQMLYECPSARSPTIASSEIFASKSSNTNLTCWIDYESYCPDSLTWHLNDNRTPLPENGPKFKVEEKDTHSTCKKEFILSIFNVTEIDEGTYSCHWHCEYENTTKAAIDLKVFNPQPTEISEPTASTTTKQRTTSNQLSTVLGSPTYLGSGRDWLLPIIILSAGSVAVLIMLFIRFIVKKKWTSSYNIKKHGLVETDFINRLFISYSSKDFGWVTENLISILEKHSIDYSIHSRDFELGRPIVQNMADSVYGSRQVLIVLSENYLASNFCREELHMAIQRGLDVGDSSLILVKINDLKKKKLPTALRKKRLLDFDKHRKKQDWEEKILREILEGKLTANV